MEELKKRKSPRHPNFDYNSTGVYFITICTQNRCPILSHIVWKYVPDCPNFDASTHVGTGVPDCPDFDTSTHVGTGVPDCPDLQPKIELTKYGQIADKYLKQFNAFYTHLSIEDYVIMPNHIHLLLWVRENKNVADSGQSGTPVPTGIGGGCGVERSNNMCSQFVSTFKRFCNKEYGENIWQARFHDHIIRNRDDCREHIKYIRENPIRWYYDELYTEE